MKNELYSELRKQMVNDQIISRGIKTKKIIDAFINVPRHKFISNSYQYMAYDDHPLPIDNNQTISQPYMVALMTDQLDIQKTDKVLEIGTGSGYQTAILAYLANHVYTVELHEMLSIKAKQILDELEYKNIHYHIGNGYHGLNAYAPFDKIIVTAAPKQFPKELMSQLKESGKMIIPIGDSYLQQLFLVEKENTHFKKSFITYCRFVEMVNKD
ncbi:MAG: protein-L-isoaspartate(D-aspartate) O-methyltransferase [Tenericutes bacterium]|nr:protein-L-isoaspartate(D-aspartate) O-methyltransferase [Mycoplasmatota bacterium]